MARPNSESEHRHRHPGQRRDHPQELERRLQDALGERDRADQQPERRTEPEGDGEACPIRARLGAAGPHASPEAISSDEEASAGAGAKPGKGGVGRHALQNQPAANHRASKPRKAEERGQPVEGRGTNRAPIPARRGSGAATARSTASAASITPRSQAQGLLGVSAASSAARRPFGIALERGPHEAVVDEVARDEIRVEPFEEAGIALDDGVAHRLDDELRGGGVGPGLEVDALRRPVAVADRAARLVGGP